MNEPAPTPLPAAKAGRKALGQWGEEQAASHLSGLGLTIIARNWRDKSGEIDIIATDGTAYIFVEVRTRRTSGRFGTPEESVDARKQRQVRETARLYLYRKGKWDIPCRFDVIAVTGPAAPGQPYSLRHIPHAF